MKRSRPVAVAMAVGLFVVLPTSAKSQFSGAAGLRTTVPFELGRFDLGLGGSVHRLETPIGARTPFTFESSIRLPLSSGGFWLGSSLEGAREVDSVPVRPLLSGGFWRTVRDMRVSIGAYSRTARVGGRPPRTWQVPFDTTIGDSVVHLSRTYGDSAPSRAALWSDLEARLSWRIGVASMEGVLGTRGRVAQFAPALWGRLGVNYPLSSYLALWASAGVEPPRIGLGVPASGFASVAMRVRPWRNPSRGSDLGESSSLVVRRDAAGSYRFTFVAMNAKSVEVSGDFARWHPVALREMRPGVWETTVAITPGTYHINVRVDGGRWIAPPGLPQTDDDFNGAVGVLLVR